MVCLLRNLQPNVSPPAMGFDALPPPAELTDAAHIARIKYYKNYLVSHSNDGELSDANFKKIWTDLEMAIHGIGNPQDVADVAVAKSIVLDNNVLLNLGNLDYEIRQLIIKKLTEDSKELAGHTTKIAILEKSVESIEKEVQSVKKDVKMRSSKGAFKEFKDTLVRCTILDKEVLDNLISKCIMTVDDRDDIDSLAEQSSRNQRLLEILMHRPYNAFNIFVEAMKESDQQCHTQLVTNMEAIVTDKVLTLKNVPQKDEIAGIEKQTVKLIKWYNTIVHEIDIDKPGSLENLFSKELISQQDNTVVTSENTSQQEKIRRLLEEIIRKNASSSYTAFLEFLKEDICYMEYATKIEETDISDFDLELLCIGKRMKHERKRRNGMTGKYSCILIERLRQAPSSIRGI
ncbi:Hypothetical predicted protein [Mytilus galloprovincialis]|uniref:CARD domain-containing protein n=1 Tax=Mytilus galloprovincialis TaxID=29158 RepID=A0A8B6ECK3_MYTGA|nr:Hypothetical predicted protein [Mytilus galloprovincialis]